MNSDIKYENNNNLQDLIERDSVKKLDFNLNTSPIRDNSKVNSSINLHSDQKQYRDHRDHYNPYESNPNRKDESRNLEDITLDNTNANDHSYININN